MRNMRIAIPVTDMDTTNYVNAVVGVTGEPVVISQGRSKRDVRPAEYLERSDFKVEDFDGLLLPGGGDISPSRYGHKNEGSVGISNELDELQLSILDQFVKAGKPILGICRGHELINIYFGGTLHQDIKTAGRHARDIPAYENPDKVHLIHANNGSWLAHIYDATFRVNSAHHQAIDRIGKDLIVDARCADDGVIEAAHHTSLPIFSTQFHPERMSFLATNDETINGEDIFWRLIDLCEKRVMR